MTTPEGDRTLARLECFAEVPHERVAEFDALCTWKMHGRDEVILERATDTQDALFIVGGEARVVYRLDDGGEIRLATLGPYDVIGALSAVDEEPRSATVIANKESCVATMHRDTFLGICRTEPGVALGLLQRFAAIIRNLNTRVKDLSLLTPQQRLYGEILRLARRSDHIEAPLAVAEMPPHDELAGWANTTRDVVAYEIGSLTRRGIVERKHKTLYIRDPEMLRNLAGGRYSIT
jgi:CRP/FNR family cyclic AMP-dependent transcriptional regulator